MFTEQLIVRDADPECTYDIIQKQRQEERESRCRGYLDALFQQNKVVSEQEVEGKLIYEVIADEKQVAEFRKALPENAEFQKLEDHYKFQISKQVLLDFFINKIKEICELAKNQTLSNKLKLKFTLSTGLDSNQHF